jgi:hypothetical protein
MPFNSEQMANRAYLVLDGILRVMRPARVLVVILFLALLHNPARALSVTLPSSYNVTLAWDASTGIGVAGYSLYYGTASRNYSNRLVTGDVTSAVVSGLSNGVTYYFAVTAVTASGLESDFSNEVSYQRVLPGIPVRISGGFNGNGPFILMVSGPSGLTCNIEATEDLSAWTVIGTVTLGVGGSQEFTDTNAPLFLKRFYRARDTQP